MTDERYLIQPDTIRSEIVSQMGRPVEFRCERVYQYETDQWWTEFAFEADGRLVNARLSDAGRGMSLEHLATRVIAPMVATWKRETSEGEKA